MGLLGIDIGTSALKACLYGLDGALQTRASIEYGRAGADLHPEQLWNSLRSAVRKVTSATEFSPVCAIAISSHGESFVPVGERGEPLCPFILNTAACGGDEADEFARRFGKAEIFAATGLPVHSMYTLPKIAWLRHQQPELFGRAARFLCVEDYLMARAGVGPYISTSLASRTMGLDIVARCWSPTLLDIAGINADMLAIPVAPGTPLGTAAPAVCDELNLPRNALWVAGGHDQGCCSLGAGGIRERVAVDGSGTFECLSIPVRRPFLSAAALRCNFPSEIHAAPNLFLTLAYVAGGIALKWFRDTLSRSFVEQATNQNADPYSLMLADLPDEPTDLIAFPHLIGTGTPWLNGGARGAIFGLDASTTYAQVAKAILEGITMEMLWNIDLQKQSGIELERIHAVGGGARSSAWLQLKADAFGQEVVAIEGEASCAGAAICAALGARAFADVDQATEAFVRPGRRFEPRSEQHARYREKLAAYQRLAGRVFDFPSP
jgi:xylulokinase